MENIKIEHSCDYVHELDDNLENVISYIEKADIENIGKNVCLNKLQKAIKCAFRIKAINQELRLENKRLSIILENGLGVKDLLNDI